MLNASQLLSSRAQQLAERSFLSAPEASGDSEQAKDILHRDFLAQARAGHGLAKAIEEGSTLEDSAQLLELINAVARNPRLESCVKVNSIVAALDALANDLADRHIASLDAWMSHEELIEAAGL